MLEKVVIVKLGIGLVAAVLGLVLVGLSRFERLSPKRFLIEATLLTAATRFGLFFVVYFVAKQPAQSDVLMYYKWAKEVLPAGLPYRDNLSCYAPLFSHLSGLPLYLFDSPLTIVVVAILFEIASVPVWYLAGQRLVGDRVARLATLLSVAAGVACFCSSVLGVNQSWMALLIGLAVLLLARSRPVASGVTLGISMVAVKFIALLYIPSFFFTADRGKARWAWLAAFGLLTVAVYGGFAPFCDVMFPFRQMGREYASGNIPLLLSAVGVPFIVPDGDPILRITSLVGVAVLAAITLACIARRSGRTADMIPWLALATFAVMLVGRKSHVWYVAMINFPVCAAAVSYRGKYWAALVLGLLGAIALPESSLYFRNMHGNAETPGVDFRVLWQVGRADPLFIRYVIILALNIVQVTLYVTLAWAAWRTLVARPAADVAMPDAPSLANSRSRT